MLGDIDLVDRIAGDIRRLGVAGEQNLAAALYLVYTSRKLAKPLVARVRGPSASGKSFIIDAVAEMMPPESIIRATQMTPQSLFHMEKGSLRHKLIVAGERSRATEDEAAEATRALREMISARRLSKLMPVKVGNEMKTELIEQDGPIAFVESTTLGDVFAEDENRALPLYTDEREEQTERIISALGQQAAGQGTTVAERQRALDVHYAAQRMLRRYDVLIPFAPQIGARISRERVEVRRAFPALLSMIQASALMHQFQRQRSDDGRLQAERQDYEVATTLLGSAMRRLIGGGVSEPAERFWRKLKKTFKEGHTWGTADAAGKTKANKNSVKVWVAELRNAGFLQVISESRGRKGAEYRLTAANPDQAAANILPDAEEVFGCG
jgi:hypothetical protein